MIRSPYEVDQTAWQEIDAELMKDFAFHGTPEGEELIRQTHPAFKGGEVTYLLFSGLPMPVRIHSWMPDGILTRSQAGRPDEPFLISPRTFDIMKRLDDRCLGIPTEAEGWE